MTNNPYRIFGIGLMLAGAIFAPVAYFLINSIPLTSIALSLVMVGSVCILSVISFSFIPSSHHVIIALQHHSVWSVLFES